MQISNVVMIIIRAWLLSLPRKIKMVLQVIFDVMVLTISFVAAYILDVENVSQAMGDISWSALLLGIPFCIVTFHFIGVYRTVLRFSAAKMLAMLFSGGVASAFLLLAFSFVVGEPLGWVVVVNFALVSGVLFSGGRFILQTFFRSAGHSAGKSSIIYGTGDFGRQLLTSIQQSSEFVPVALIDETEEMVGSIIGGIKVHKPSVLENLVVKLNVKVVFLATKSVSRQAQRELVELLKGHQVQIQRIPAVSDIVLGRSKITDFQEVVIEDLLGRKSVPANLELMHEKTAGKSVLVTGAGGSIGSEICRQVFNAQPQSLVLVEISEYALYSIERELSILNSKLEEPVNVVPVLANVLNKSLIAEKLSLYEVDTVFHAAAFKHVPLLEQNVAAAIENNVLGTKELLDAAISSNVSSFTMISTDKAVRPTNVMGASKRLAELVCQAYADAHLNITISMVRFGNVLGSSGSVIPLFREQIKAGGPVGVTDKEMTRYFMTIPEASQLVIQSSALAKGGDVLILDMGEPIKIIDLARSMIHLAGYKPYIEADLGYEQNASADHIEITFSGVRPGEKMYEELLLNHNVTPTRHTRIMQAKEPKIELAAIHIILEELRACLENKDMSLVIKMLERLPLQYSSKTI